MSVAERHDRLIVRSELDALEHVLTMFRKTQAVNMRTDCSGFIDI